ncbi:MAG: endonuclease III domain-containing protein [Candidatus Aenigmarchaeota archaeon]|nr:endonuclease III domain-containing protein [Candidatus Aenigmarchaeota archaeon]
MLKKVYEILLNRFGPQGWWPVYSKNKKYEICIGAILTQNTAWNNVEKALSNLRKDNLLEPKEILRISEKKLKRLIKPAGFFNQKAKRIKRFTKFFLDNPDPTREELLAIKGIGPETADSILLYAFNKPEFVIDAYTKRIFSRFGLIKTQKYSKIKLLFEKRIKKDVKIYKEYHALIVKLAKEYCRKKPICERCPLKNICKKTESSH